MWVCVGGGGGGWRVMRRVYWLVAVWGYNSCRQGNRLKNMVKSVCVWVGGCDLGGVVGQDEGSAWREG